jgi:hypothetical protein
MVEVLRVWNWIRYMDRLQERWSLTPTVRVIMGPGPGQWERVTLYPHKDSWYVNLLTFQKRWYLHESLQVVTSQRATTWRITFRLVIYYLFLVSSFILIQNNRYNYCFIWTYILISNEQVDVTTIFLTLFCRSLLLISVELSGSLTDTFRYFLQYLYNDYFEISLVLAHHKSVSTQFLMAIFLY